MRGGGRQAALAAGRGESYSDVIMRLAKEMDNA
jgi:hypothetical protein